MKNKNSFKVTMNLTREKAIDMLISENMTYTFDIDLNDLDDLDVDSMYENWDCELDNFKDDIKDKIKELKKKKQELTKLPTHEIYELGEKKGYWHLNERQMRLNLQ